MSATIPTGLCHCGCGEATRIAPCTDASKGWIKGQPLRFRRFHASRLTVPYVIDDAGCWIWQGAIGRDGYGRTRHGDSMALAHRAYFQHARGEIPDGLVLDHLCRVRACVNPAHLEPVTQAENCRRGAKAKLSPQLVAEIRASSESDRALAEHLGVGKSTVQSARSEVSWA